MERQSHLGVSIWKKVQRRNVRRTDKKLGWQITEGKGT